MEQFFDAQSVDIMVKLFLAMVFGMAIGAERLLANKTAGMRTFALISMGSALFVIISTLVAASLPHTLFDPLRMAAQVIAGAGFLGAGLVLVKGDTVTGITSSAGLWVSAAIGMAAGFGLYALALIGTVLTLFIFIVLWFIEERMRHLRIAGGIKEDKE